MKIKRCFFDISKGLKKYYDNIIKKEGKNSVLYEYDPLLCVYYNDKMRGKKSIRTNFEWGELLTHIQFLNCIKYNELIEVKGELMTKLAINKAIW